MRLTVFALVALFFSAVSAQDIPANRMPDKSKTPGHATYHTRATVCAAYGIEKCKSYCSGPGGCEVDHLISLELGGANTSDNLWPQPYNGEWNAIDKDRLEKRMQSLICTKKTLDLKDAQREIATDWVAAYKKYVGARKTSHPQQRCGL